MAAKKAQEVVEIRPLDIQKVTVHIAGDTPLIMHKWSEKAKRLMIETQTGARKGREKEKRDPLQDFISAAYFVTDPTVDPNAAERAEEAKQAKSIEEFNEACENGAHFGFPVTAFKQAAISAAYRMGWAKDKMSLRGMFFIDADKDGLVEIHSDTPVMREDMVKIGMGTADLRYRPEFRNWNADLTISYNKNGPYNLESILNMLNAAGYVCGIGEWRVERDGQFGMFHLAS